MQKVAVIGSGTIGSSWALFFALRGFIVSLYDIDENTHLQAISKIKDNIYFLFRKDLITEKRKTEALFNIKLAQDIGSSVEGAFWVQESISESYTVKNSVFKDIESCAEPTAIIASSTSTLSVNCMQEAFSLPERFLVAHPFNPPHLIPLIEIVPGEKTSAKTLETARAFFYSLGKEPVVLNKEVSGYIANRLSAALWREAIDLVEQGVCSVKEIDKAVFSGPGLRWALMGPHLTYHLEGGKGGIKHFLEHIGPAFEKTMEDLAKWSKISQGARDRLYKELQKECSQEEIEKYVFWRDKKLIELLKLKDIEV